MRIFSTHKIKITFIPIFLFAFGSVAYSQTLTSKIDSLLELKFKANEPGAVFLVSKNDSVLYRKALGLSNLELGVPMQPDNVFKIGSMTKQFTAISIMILMEQGKLNLSDDITKFIPDYPTHGKRITVHHLLTHTSGIKNFTSMKEINNIARNDLTPLEVIDFFKNESMDFEPGEDFKYNNSGYFILGYIIELLSGGTYADFVQKNIFNKINMTSSFYASHEKIIKHRAYGYHKKDEFVNAKYISFSLPYSSGSLMSTVDDMLQWQHAISNDLLIKKSTLEKVFTSYKLNSGESINYGYGWHLKEINGTPTREHGGSIFGFKSMAVFVPSSNIYVIGLSNCDCNSPTQITRDITKLAIELN